MRRTHKRLGSLLLVMAMLLTLLPVSAMAADDDTAPINPNPVSNETELKSAVANAVDGTETTIMLGADIALANTLAIPAGKNIVLNLNGCAVTVPPADNGRSIYAVDNYGTLTICDMSAEKDGSISSRGVENYGTMTLESGTINSIDSNGGGAAVWNEATFNMSGGTLAFTGTKTDSGSGIALNNQADATTTITGGTLRANYACVFNSGNMNIENALLTGGDKYWNVIKVFGGSNLVLRNVTVNAQYGGGIEVNGGIVDIYDSVFTQTGYYDHNSMNIAVSSNGTVNVHSGSFNSDNFGVYVFNSGGTVNVEGGTFSAQKDVLKADNSKYDTQPSVINVTGGDFTGPFSVEDEATLAISGGTFSSDVSDYVALSSKWTKTEEGKYEVAPISKNDGVAEINGKYYKSLSDAITSAKDGDTVTLLRNTSISTQISVNKNLTLDLGGKTLTNSGTGFAFVVNTDRTFILTNGMLKSDSGSGVAGVKGTKITIDRTATIDTKNYALFGTNNSDNEGHAIFNVYGTLRSDSIGIFIQGPCNIINIDGANITSNYFGVYQNGSYGGGTFTIKNSTIVDKSSTGVYISNSKENADNTGQGYHTLNIQNSKITGDTGVEVKFTNVTISGENTEITATGTPVDLTLNNNGAVSTGYALAITHNAKDADKDAAAGTITVENGKFSGVIGIQEPSDGQTTAATMTITGGLFSSDPSAYCVEGKTGVTNTDPATSTEYPFMIDVAQENAAVPVPAEPEVKNPAANQGTDADKALANSVALALKPSSEQAPIPSITGGVLDAAVNTLANQNTTTEEQAREALENEDISTEGKSVTVAVQHYMDITITEAKAQTGENTKTLTLDIKPMVQKVATTANLEQNQEIVLKKDATAEKPANAVEIGGPVEVNVTGSVTVSIPLPAGFTTGNTLYIKHITDNGRTYYYTGAVKENILTFTNPHGFSSFTISAVNDAAAEVNGVGYPTLQAAVDAVENNGIIKLLKDGESATVDRTVKFTVEPANKNCTIHAGAYTTVEKNGNTYTCVYTAPSTGGGSYEPSGDYVVSVDKTVGGKVTVNPGRADKGDTVTITVKPDKGYELDSLIVTAKDGGAVKLTEKSANKFTFKMPGSKVTVEAVFVKEETKPVVTLPFADVNKGDWYYDAVEYVYENDLMNGTSATTFSPFVTTSRAMILTILARYDGVDTSTGSTWYEAGAVWAIAEGVSDGTNLEANLTREQLVTMLWRYAGSPVVESDLSGYPDSASVSDWAVNAMIWAVESGVITGNGAGALNPQGTATRAEVATILMRFIEK